VVFLCQLDNDVAFTISLGRIARLRLNAVFPVISALYHRFWMVLAGEYVHDKKADNSLEQALEISAGTVKVHRKNI